MHAKGLSLFACERDRRPQRCVPSWPPPFRMPPCVYGGRKGRCCFIPSLLLIASCASSVLVLFRNFSSSSVSFYFTDAPAACTGLLRALVGLPFAAHLIACPWERARSAYQSSFAEYRTSRVHARIKKEYVRDESAGVPPCRSSEHSVHCGRLPTKRMFLALVQPQKRGSIRQASHYKLAISLFLFCRAKSKTCCNQVRFE